MELEDQGKLQIQCELGKPRITPKEVFLLYHISYHKLTLSEVECGDKYSIGLNAIIFFAVIERKLGV